MIFAYSVTPEHTSRASVVRDGKAAIVVKSIKDQISLVFDTAEKMIEFAQKIEREAKEIAAKREVERGGYAGF